MLEVFSGNSFPLIPSISRPIGSVKLGLMNLYYQIFSPDHLPSENTVDYRYNAAKNPLHRKSTVYTFETDIGAVEMLCSADFSHRANQEFTEAYRTE